MTLANKISVFRLLLVPFFVLEWVLYAGGSGAWHRVGAIAIFAVAAVSDAIDGMVARFWHQESDIGTKLDPLADKLLIVSSVIILTFFVPAPQTPFPLWFTYVLVGRETVLIGGYFMMAQNRRPVKVRPRRTGKLATVMLIGCITASLLQLPWQWIAPLIYATAGITVFSGLQYIRDGAVQTGLNRSNAPASQPRRDPT